VDISSDPQAHNELVSPGYWMNILPCRCPDRDRMALAASLCLHATAVETMAPCFASTSWCLVQPSAGLVSDGQSHFHVSHRQPTMLNSHPGQAWALKLHTTLKTYYQTLMRPMTSKGNLRTSPQPSVSSNTRSATGLETFLQAGPP
jgi:hypothetical protein